MSDGPSQGPSASNAAAYCRRGSRNAGIKLRLYLHSMQQRPQAARCAWIARTRVRSYPKDGSKSQIALCAELRADAIDTRSPVASPDAGMHRPQAASNVHVACSYADCESNTNVICSVASCEIAPAPQIQTERAGCELNCTTIANARRRGDISEIKVTAEDAERISPEL